MKPRENRFIPSVTKTISLLYSFDSVLSIGIRRVNCVWLELFKEKDVEFLEIFNRNVQKIRDLGYVVHKGDVRTFVPNRKYDVVVWSHGPEHIKKEEIPDTLALIESYTTKIVILLAPWGLHEQGISHDNINECHLSTLYEDDFPGYNVWTVGEKDVKKSEIVAWRYI
jgi:hypothetical protein